MAFNLTNKLFLKCQKTNFEMIEIQIQLVLTGEGYRLKATKINNSQQVFVSKIAPKWTEFSPFMYVPSIC